MSKSCVIPSLNNEAPLGDGTGHFLELSQVELTDEQLNMLVTYELRLDGQPMHVGEIPVSVDGTSLPDSMPIDPRVLKSMGGFFFQSVERLINAGLPVAVLQSWLEAAMGATQSAPLCIETEAGQVYRCSEFLYEDRPVTRVTLARTERHAPRIVLVDGEFSAWSHPQVTLEHQR